MGRYRLTFLSRGGSPTFNSVAVFRHFITREVGNGQPTDPSPVFGTYIRGSVILVNFETSAFEKIS